ncbi:hypothetical protein CEP51_004613 [Fusarium floridanum]|uniref:Uncharacterized protein n=1 Tax=Fusarium floridanum TaxID=1325733 RepID=A0A428S0J6_9HYPO|nr:hypothetical protein CEP51_004613 [Fusarium floridanum]
MKTSLFLIPLFSLIWASPAAADGLSIFEDDSIPVEDQPKLESFTFSGHDEDKRLAKRALNLEYILLDVTFDGYNKGNWQGWRVRGELLVIRPIPSPGTTNGPNPVDVVIAIGSPAVSPVAGSIRYTTNRYLNVFIGGRKDTTRVDFARVSTTASSVTVSVDTSIAAANQLSIFNARSGSLANIYNPASGGFSLAFWKNGQVTGKIGLVGRSPTSGGQAPYVASISGLVKQKGKIWL